MNNPNDVVQNKHLDALAARIADNIGGTSTTSSSEFDAELDGIFRTQGGTSSITEFDNELDNIFGGVSTCSDFDAELDNIFGTEE